MRLRQHVNPLSLAQMVGAAERPALPADREVEVELGCGDGRFLFERARVAPAGFYLGVEIRREWVERIRAAGASNVTAVRANLVVAAGLFPPASVARLFVNFPDPYFKQRHRPRRWLTAETAALLRDALVPGGELFFQSDVFEPALDALDVLHGTPGLANATGDWRFSIANPYGARSSREAWCERNGIKVWRLLFRKG